MAELTVPQIDFSSLGQLPDLYRKAQDDQNVRQTLASLGQGGQVDANALLRSGNLSLAQLGLNLQQKQAEAQRQTVLDARQAQRDKIGDQHWSSSFELQKRAADRADEDKFALKEITDPNTGATTIVRVKTTGAEGPINTGVAPSTPANPFSAGGKFNGDQGKAAGFTDRMLQSEGILSGVAPTPGSEGPPTPGVQNQGTSLTESKLGQVPVVGNYLVSNDQQKYTQAKADFINAQLRRESGAAIAASEFTAADKQYFPLPGDKPEVIKQKAANRRASIEAMGREGGQSYRPKYQFGEDGSIVGYGPSTPTKNPNAPDSAFPPPPKLGELRGGYRFRGGNPGDPANWAKAAE